MTALIVGFGNPLAGDDGAGPAVIELLAADDRFAGHELRAPRQLTPELAADIAAADLVVLIDATVDGGPPGGVRVRAVGAGGGRSSITHHVAPETVLELARELYRAVPPTFLVTVTAADLRLGHELSEPVRRVLPRMAATVGELVAGRTRGSSIAPAGS